MGFFGLSSSPKKKDGNENAQTSVAATSEELRKQQQLAEREELALIIAGAPDESARVEDTNKFIRANQRHTYVDCAWGVAVYTFSGLQHVHGQSTALTLLSMWAAGTTFLVNAAMRKILTEASRTSLEVGGGGEEAPHTDAMDRLASSKATVLNTARGKGSSQPAGAASTASDSSGGKKNEAGEQATNQLRTIASAADFDTQRRNVFQLEAVASWIWMLGSFQQFRVHKRLKWCGYSSWMGLGCAAYYSFRHMYNVLVM